MEGADLLCNQSTDEEIKELILNLFIKDLSATEHQVKRFTGHVMRELKGRADPKYVSLKVREILEADAKQTRRKTFFLRHRDEWFEKSYEDEEEGLFLLRGIISFMHFNRNIDTDSISNFYSSIDGDSVYYNQERYAFTSDEFDKAFHYLDKVYLIKGEYKDRVVSKSVSFPEKRGYFTLRLKNGDSVNFVWRLLIGQGSACQLFLESDCMGVDGYGKPWPSNWPMEFDKDKAIVIE